MDSPFFSVVTVTLNARDAAERTARNVLAQRFTSFEYVVKDGVSTDQTAEAVSALGLVRVLSQTDNGVYDAMNQALGYCRGRYVCFMNAGDEFADAEVLRRVAQSIERAGFPEFAFGDARTMSKHPGLPASDPLRSARVLRYPTRPSRFWLFRRMICHQAWFVRTDVYRRLGGFDQRYPISSAYDLLLRMLLLDRVSAMHLPFTVVDYQGGGISDRGDPRQLTERREILRRNFGMIERAVYGAVMAIGSLLVHRLFFPVVYPRLSPELRAKVFGA